MLEKARDERQPGLAGSKTIRLFQNLKSVARALRNRDPFVRIKRFRFTSAGGIEDLRRNARTNGPSHTCERIFKLFSRKRNCFRSLRDQPRLSNPLPSPCSLRVRNFRWNLAVRRMWIRARNDTMKVRRGYRDDSFVTVRENVSFNGWNALPGFQLTLFRRSGSLGVQLACFLMAKLYVQRTIPNE